MPKILFLILIYAQHSDYNLSCLQGLIIYGEKVSTDLFNNRGFLSGDIIILD